MIDLHRDLAPMSERVWKRVESEVRDVLNLHLAARRLVDFEGPLGWEHSAIDLGRIEPITSRAGVQLHKRKVRPLIELRVPFELERGELEHIERGAREVELEPLRDAARRFAAAENAALFDGDPEAEIPGMLRDAGHEGVPLPRDATQLPEVLSEALERLRRAGVGGPYAVALGSAAYRALDSASSDGGYPVLRHVQRLVDRRVVWAPELDGGVLVSLRGGDVKLVCGRDAAIGYFGHGDKNVRLYIEESFSAELNSPEAIVPLLPSETPPSA